MGVRVAGAFLQAYLRGEQEDASCLVTTGQFTGVVAGVRHDHREDAECVESRNDEAAGSRAKV